MTIFELSADVQSELRFLGCNTSGGESVLPPLISSPFDTETTLLNTPLRGMIMADQPEEMITDEPLLADTWRVIWAANNDSAIKLSIADVLRIWDPLGMMAISFTMCQKPNGETQRTVFCLIDESQWQRGITQD